LNLSYNDFVNNGARSLIHDYYRDSPSQFIKFHQPEHTFFPWQFTHPPRGTWRIKSNRILFFHFLKRELNIERVEEWHSLTFSHILHFGGLTLLQNYFGNSVLQFLRVMIPDHKWVPWNFKSVPVNFWKDMASHAMYFEFLCEEMKITHPKLCYDIILLDVEKLRGKALIKNYYQHSCKEFVTRMNPEFSWMAWRFKGKKSKWEKMEHHTEFFHWAEQKLNIKKEEDWYSCDNLYDNFWKLGGGGLISRYYNGSPISFLQTMLPNHRWIIWKFSFAPMGFWKKANVQVSYFWWLCKELDLKVPEAIYSISGQEVGANYGSGFFKVQYSSSPEEFIRAMSPQFDWVEWRFKGTRKWLDVGNHKKFFDWLGDELGFRRASDWRRLTMADFQRFNAVTLVQAYYNSSVKNFVASHLQEKLSQEERKKEEQQWLGDTVIQLLPQHYFSYVV